jgi:transposase
MTHPVHFRKKVLSYLAAAHSMRQAASKYDLSTSTIQGWKRSLEPKTTRQSKSRTIDDNALRQDVELYPLGFKVEVQHPMN